MTPGPRRVRFGPFAADLATGELWRDGAAVAVQDLPFRLLAALLERPGDVVSRGDLAARLWGSETFVDAAAGLNTAVAKLRDALGDDAERPAYVETLPKRGYRFVAPVDWIAPAPPEPATSAATAPDHAPAAPEPVAPASRPRRRLAMAAIAVATIGVAWAAHAWLGSTAGPVRVAVVLFDNETDRPELQRFAQAMTDATVAGLTAEPRFAVIGNAAVLRTARPFRDVARIRDALDARYIVIGQVQWRDGAPLVRTHLIRGWDHAHLWIEAFPRGTASEADYQARVSGAVRRALTDAVE